MERCSESEFLEIRQRIKDSIRKNTGNGERVASTNPEERKRKLPYIDFGSFFGPSQTVIAPKVLRESKPMIESKLLNEKMLNSNESKKSSCSSTKNPKEELKIKVERLKDSRDYSFLLSDDAKLPVSINEPPSRNLATPNSKPSSQGSNSRLGSSTNGQAKKKEVSLINSQTSSKLGPQRADSVPRRPLTSSKPMTCAPRNLTSQKSLTSSKPMTCVPRNLTSPKSLTSSKPMTCAPRNLTSQKSLTSSKPMTCAPRNLSGQKTLTSSKPMTCASRNQEVKQRKVSQELGLSPSRHRVISKPPLKQQPHQVVKKKKPKRMSRDDEMALQMVREMCKTDRYKGPGFDDYDDPNMETNFEDLEKEERRSAKLARKEDAEQLRLIEEENRKEKLKKQKLTH